MTYQSSVKFPLVQIGIKTDVPLNVQIYSIYCWAYIVRDNFSLDRPSKRKIKISLTMVQVGGDYLSPLASLSYNILLMLVLAFPAFGNSRINVAGRWAEKVWRGTSNMLLRWLCPLHFPCSWSLCKILACAGQLTKAHSQNSSLSVGRAVQSWSQAQLQPLVFLPPVATSKSPAEERV